jgi:uncharacterized repeat protein (TIGR03803 family)
MNKINWSVKACGMLLLWATVATVLPAQTLTTLHSFKFTDGANPEAGLVQATNGDLYGTTEGGTNNPSTCDFALGCGTVFQITTSGALTPILYFICSPDCDFGNSPEAGLVQGSDGNLYGTTYFADVVSYGAIFEITTGGTLITSWYFNGDFGGLYPASGLVQDPMSGNLFGTTTASVGGGHGTVYSIAPSGGFNPPITTLQTFDGTDGSDPTAGLVQGNTSTTDLDFYGTTSTGGAYGFGTVFEVSPVRYGLPTLHSFYGADGSSPEAGLVLASDGNLYGTTSSGGTYGYGTIFKISTSGIFTSLYSFEGTDGSSPEAGLVQASDGNLYGTTGSGGANGLGSIFKISTSGNFTSLYSFCSKGGSSCTDGSDPVAALVQDTNGIFYGTTETGGTGSECTGGCGTVFSLNANLPQTVHLWPYSGNVQEKIEVLGTNLTGATSVTFNGTLAEFTVLSRSLITTTVPTGATSGPVEVVTPAGKVSSNAPFIVRP